MTGWMLAALQRRIEATPAAARITAAPAHAQEWTARPHHRVDIAAIASDVMFEVGAAYCPRCRCYWLPDPACTVRPIELCSRCFR